MSLRKLQKTLPSNAFPQPILVKLFLFEFYVNLTVPNKQFFSVKLLVGIRGHVFNS